MRLGGERESENVEDRRGGIGTPHIAGGGIGVVIIVLLGLYFGVDPNVLLQIVAGDQSPPSAAYPTQGTPRGAPGDDDLKHFVSVVLAETEDTWHAEFQKLGRTYEDPKLVLYSGSINSACGFAQSAVGPFYCPGDRRVYLDLSFFRDLKTRFNAPGDFAAAYVIAHEVGHHVQNLLGITDRVEQLRGRSGQAGANTLSVRVELQADCFAGVWANQANQARHILEPGDVEKGLNAASAVGDDRLQMQARGYVVPESFTHGTSAQRVHWFKRGLDTGDLRQCDTFAAQQ
jgi:uncharacterized protein